MPEETLTVERIKQIVERLKAANDTTWKGILIIPAEDPCSDNEWALQFPGWTIVREGSVKIA